MDDNYNDKIDIHKTVKLTKSHCHKVKGKGQICIHRKKKCFGYKSWTEDIDLDETYTNDKHQ